MVRRGLWRVEKRPTSWFGSPKSFRLDRWEIRMYVTDSHQESLLLAARVLQAAADQAEADTRSGSRAYVTETGVKSLLWLCGSLLPQDLDLANSTDHGRPVRVLLQEAETELRRFPICDYPAGTVDVVVGLCDLIRRTAGNPTLPRST